MFLDGGSKWSRLVSRCRHAMVQFLEPPPTYSGTQRTQPPSSPLRNLLDTPVAVRPGFDRCRRGTQCSLPIPGHRYGCGGSYSWGGTRQRSPRVPGQSVGTRFVITTDEVKTTAKDVGSSVVVLLENARRGGEASKKGRKCQIEITERGKHVVDCLELPFGYMTNQR